MDSRAQDATDNPPLVLSRSHLLSLYSSPLVPLKLDGMKPLNEWYGEYSTPPSPPIQRSQLPSSSTTSISSPSSRGNRGGARETESNASGRRVLAPFTSSENPFANFGRFGVDGGLVGEPLEPARSSLRGTRGTLRGVNDGDKDLAPHLVGTGLGGGSRRGGGGGKELEPWSGGGSGDALSSGKDTALHKRDQFFKEERERSERRGINGRNAGGGGIANAKDSDALEPKRRTGNVREGEGEGGGRKDRRGLGPADEGGWRSVGTTREEREKRLLRNQSSTSTTDSPRRFDRSERPHDRDRDTSSRSNRGERGGPAWMHDDENAGSSPSWMDAPASGSLSFSGGKVEDDARDGLEGLTSTSPKAKKNLNEWTPDGGAGGEGGGGVDSIQQWKMQMKEMERKERERDLRAAGIEPKPQPEEPEEPSSVFSALTSPKPAAPTAPTKSIFEDLGIVRSPALASATAPPPGLSKPSDQAANSAEGGGRGSRFARFFDGKPQSPTPQAAQPPPSVFGALMGGGQGGDGSKGPSKEDAESMARLMGMLQVQGSRTASPSTQLKSPVVENPLAALLGSPAPPSAPSAPPSNSGSSQAAPAPEGRSASRFKFSSSKDSPIASPATIPAQTPQHSQPPSTVHSPSTPLPPIVPISSPPPPPGFGGFSQHQQPSHPHPQSSLNNLPQAMSPGDALRSPPLPLPGAPLQHSNMHHPRTISSASDLSSRPPTNQNGLTSPPPNHSMNQHPHGGLPPPSMPPHSNGPFPPQFFTGPNGQRMPIPPPPPGMNLGMFPPGQGPSPQGMMSPELLRNHPPPINNGNGMRSPVPPPPGGGPPFPPHGVPGNGMMPPPGPHGRNQPMMFPPPPPPHGFAPPLHYQGQLPPRGPGMPNNAGNGGPSMSSLGGNAGADLMALLNSGGGMRIGGQGPPPPPPPHQMHHGHGQHPQQQHPGNLPPFMMEGR